mgnify:FL=1
MSVTKNNTMKKLLFLSTALLFNSCKNDDCTEMVNIPKWDALEMTFIDNYQEVPCGLGNPVDEPVIL